jgi:hypothetical protein
MKALSLAALSSLVGVALTLALLPGGAHAQTTAAPTAVTLSPAAPTSMKGQLALSARLTTADGKPLSGQEIDFFVPVELFGSLEAFVGSATTDSTGQATLGYQPAQAGRQTIVARFTGSSSYATSEASAEIQVGEVVPAIKAEPLPFAGLRDWLPVAMVALVLIVWGVLLGVFLGTVRGIRRAA